MAGPLHPFQGSCHPYLRPGTALSWGLLGEGARGRPVTSNPKDHGIGYCEL
jgi:hypothetical protein